MTPRRNVESFSLCVRIFMPSATCVVQEAG